MCWVLLTTIILALLAYAGWRVFRWVDALMNWIVKDSREP